VDHLLCALSEAMDHPLTGARHCPTRFRAPGRNTVVSTSRADTGQPRTGPIQGACRPYVSSTGGGSAPAPRSEPLHSDCRSGDLLFSSPTARKATPRSWLVATTASHSEERQSPPCSTFVRIGSLPTQCSRVGYLLGRSLCPGPNRWSSYCLAHCLPRQSC
jgi:hypothetical protein